jgi:(1->4)-alpha-D-glucan 1-alpha-D-glucosylmutase
MTDVFDRLAVDATKLAAARRRVPGATYRLQMHAGFTLNDARRILPYLHSLGVTHAYVSSLLSAKTGSTHGYDVRNHELLSAELGSDADFAAFVEEVRRLGMGLILDTVPNHMCVTCDNTWWYDVLENGPSSIYAAYFDIAWKDHPREQLHGKVLLPILGEAYAKTLEAGEFQPAFEHGAFLLHLSSHRLPLDPRTYGTILTPVLEAAKASFEPEDADLLELQSILSAIRHLPSRNEEDPKRIEEGRVEGPVIKRRLAALTERNQKLADEIQTALSRLAGTPGDPASFAALDQLLEAQAYRPAFWRVASDEINYRRFFDVNDLAALSTEREEVFRAIHKKIFDWLVDGVADGLRIDHPDGLFDPKQYLDRLQLAYRMACARHLLATKASDYPGLTWEQVRTPLRERFRAEPEHHLYVVVEKILGHNEPLPADWTTDGTTGYEFLNVVNGLFVDPAREDAVTGVFHLLTGFDEPFEQLVYEKKFQILQSLLSSELHMLGHQLDRLAQQERWSRDFTLNGLRHALREVIACFPVYRSYVNGEVHETDKPMIHRAVRRARRRNPLLGRQVFDYIRDTLLLKDPPSGPAAPEYRAAQRRFAGKFQQVTSPVMAKGLEDTAFYVFNRLVSLNEVGGDPGRFGWLPARAHRFFRERSERFPAAMSPLATHDTKRGEDVRARINVLAEMPEEWGRRVRHWTDLNRRHRVEIEDGVMVPDANEEYLLYQTLIGAWPIEPVGKDEYATFVDRIQAYMNKALHEAKVNTSWINPDSDYDAAVQQFLGRVLDEAESPEFLADLRAFQKVVSHFGMYNSLSQTVVRCTAPGVPDTYQGTELWDFSLVDPDNRRPVDYEARIRLLDDLDTEARGDRKKLARSLIEHKEDGRVKLFVVAELLRLRARHPELFLKGAYEPLDAVGERRDHLFTYARTAGDEAIVVAVPRLVVELAGAHERVPLGPRLWRDTRIKLPESHASGIWTHLFTGYEMQSKDGHVAAVELFAEFPVAVLTSRSN